VTCRRLATAIVVGLVLSALSSPASAGPPFETDDPEPVACHHVELDIAEARQGEPASTGYVWEADYGPTQDIETSIGGQPGEIDLATAIRFVPETVKTPQVGFLPALTIKSDGEKELFLPFWAQKTIKRWTIFGGGGASFGSEFTGVAVTRNFPSGSNVGLEFYHENRRNPTIPAAPRLGLGWTDQFAPSQAFMVWGGRSLAPNSKFLFYVGIQAVLSPAGHAPNCHGS
jgi:hypothetical protein